MLNPYVPGGGNISKSQPGFRSTNPIADDPFAVSAKPRAVSGPAPMFRTPSGRMVSSIDEVNFEIFGTRRPAPSNLSADQQAAFVSENREADAVLRQGFTDEMRRATAQMQAQGMGGDQIMQTLAQQFPEANQRPAGDNASPLVAAPVPQGTPMPKPPASVYAGPVVSGMPKPPVPVINPTAQSARPGDLSSIPDYQFTEDRLNNMLASNSTFMREAQRRGMEAAGTRGGLNSSIAAGLSTREAIRAAAPIATADAQFTQEDYLTGRRANLDDMLRENDSVRTMRRDTLLGDIRSREMNQEADLMSQRDRNASMLRRQEAQYEAELSQAARDNDAQRSVWMNTQNELTRSYTQAMSDARRSGLSFLDQLGAAFINDPEVYSPEVVSGMSNFFNSLVSRNTNSAVSTIISDIIGFNTQPVRNPGDNFTQPVRPPEI